MKKGETVFPAPPFFFTAESAEGAEKNRKFKDREKSWGLCFGLLISEFLRVLRGESIFVLPLTPLRSSTKLKRKEQISPRRAQRAQRKIKFSSNPI
jgi:hypothetical protein